MRFSFCGAVCLLFLGGCGSGTAVDNVDSGGGANDGASAIDSSLTGDSGTAAPIYPELWYSVTDKLIYIELDPSDGTVAQLLTSTITNPPPTGQNFITMLEDGSLVGGRLNPVDDQTYFYHIKQPPRDGSDVTIDPLGMMIDDLMLEGMYTDCDWRLYGMDTGTDVTNANGNRLLRFTGNLLAGDFTYVVVSDLATADVADIDDMGPGITDNEITDNPGLAIDTGTVHEFNFETGSGTEVGSGGTFGIHALGRQLFTDDTARLYVFSQSADLYLMDPVNYQVGDSLAQGPNAGDGSSNGWSGITGPLTDCESGFTIDPILAHLC